VLRIRPLRSLLAVAAAAVTTAAGAVTLTVVAAPAPAHALENGQARTPPMGFNNWNSTGCRAEFNETMIRGVADIFVNRGLRDAGYQYVNIDDCWAEPRRNAQGNLVPHRTRFPSGIRALADYVHSRGLKFGIYTSAGTLTCNRDGRFPGAINNEQRDANLFASWGVDYIKYDNCGNHLGMDARTRYTRMRDALLATRRPIVYSICEWGRAEPKVWTWAEPVGNLWRTTDDIRANWGSIMHNLHINENLARYAGPGHWNDPDMLEVGNGSLTATEQRSHFSLWAIMAAPLLIGTDLRRASQQTIDILTNRDVIAVDQDPLGQQGTLVKRTNGLAVYSKVLANGDRAVALFNESAATATISTTAAEIGLAGSPSYGLFDLWSKARRTTTGAISASVPSHGTVMYRVSRSGPAPGPDRHEAENARFVQGTVESTHAGFSGTGYVNYTNAAGGYVEWTVTAAQAGQVTLRFGYANGVATNRAMDIAVNGELAVDDLAFPGTGAWTSYRTVTATVTLAAGANTIRAAATTADGGPNTDYVEVA
jgi:alpha-galactosidase